MHRVSGPLILFARGPGIPIGNRYHCYRRRVPHPCGFGSRKGAGFDFRNPLPSHSQNRLNPTNPFGPRDFRQCRSNDTHQ